MGKGKTKPKRAAVNGSGEEVDEMKLFEIMGALVKVPPKHSTNPRKKSGKKATGRTGSPSQT